MCRNLILCIRIAKCFIAGPGSDLSAASRPMGQEKEIVPLDNITQVGKGDFQFQVIFNGKPFDNITVTAEKVGNDSKISRMTEKDGKVTFKPVCRLITLRVANCRRYARGPPLGAAQRYASWRAFE
jgi:hypothetical protein